MTVLVVGGGVAGAAAACLLGPRVTLFERSQGPHDKVCGEFVSWEAQAALSRLGLNLAPLGGHPIHSVRLVHGTRVAEARLPGLGLGLSRRVLDEALLSLAAARGAHVRRGRAVRRITPEGIAVEGEGEMAGDLVLLATGKHALRGLPRRQGDGSMVAFKTYYALDPAQYAALSGHVEVVLFPGGYAGLQLVEGGRANLCLLMRRPTLAGLGGDWPGVLAHLARTTPHLVRRLAAAAPLLPRPLSIAGVPYGFVHPGGGPARLGDQMAVIPSFSGDGMAIALHTAFAAASGMADYHARMRRDLQGQLNRAMVLHRLGCARPGLLSAAARLWPGGLRTAARLTRVSPR